MKVSAIKCPTCKDVIFSRARHDYHTCSCGEIAIDGGFEYLRMAFKGAVPKPFKLEVKATKNQLYEDWSTSADKYGVIPGKRPKKQP